MKCKCFKECFISRIGEIYSYEIEKDKSKTHRFKILFEDRIIWITKSNFEECFIDVTLELNNLLN